VRSATAIIKVRWHATASGGGHAGSADGLLSYISERDWHPDLERADDVEGLTRYIAWRDQATPDGRLFDAEGTSDEMSRRRLADYIERSVDGLESTPGWRLDHNRKAMYHLILSPEDSHGLDLRRATRSVMAQLERDAGTGGLPPWIAAEHRNTLHPHVHVVMAARRQLASGRYRRLDIPVQRLDRLHEALASDLQGQRGDRLEKRHSVLRAIDATSRPAHRRESPAPSRSDATMPDQRPMIETLSWSRTGERDPGLRPDMTADPVARVGRIAGKLARHYMREAEREAMRRLESSRRPDRERDE
jgi:hypothetical protein